MTNTKDTDVLLLEWWNYLGIHSDTATSVEMRRHNFCWAQFKAVDEEFCCWSQLGLREALHKCPELRSAGEVQLQETEISMTKSVSYNK